MKTIVDDLHPLWQSFLGSELRKPYFEELIRFIETEYQSSKCYPEPDQIFSAFQMCAPDDVRVVIIGQDPYHGSGQAHGLCFSVNNGVAFPPSLKNIFTEVRADVGVEYPVSGNLERWAKQGILLLNSTMTVREGQAYSHKNSGWEMFTDHVINRISANRQNVVFMLWGGHARKKSRMIDYGKHLVLEAGHPSPLSANKGHWFGNRHFSKANAYLIANGIAPIEW